MSRNRVFVAAILALALASAGVASPMAPVDLANRTAEATALDAARRPLEVLAASGIRSGDTVLDVMAGSGYYSELIARGVGAGGKVIALEPPRFLDKPEDMAKWTALMAHQPNITLLKSLPGDAALPNGLDAAFFHLTYHDLYWESEKYSFPRMDPAAFNARLFKAMNKGGSVIVIDHVGVAGMEPRAQAEKTHRIDPAVVKADFEKAGFRFVAESPVLRTAGDDPATLVFDPAVRGKNDHFFYRFVKP